MIWNEKERKWHKDMAELKASMEALEMGMTTKQTSSGTRHSASVDAKPSEDVGQE